MFWGLYWFPGFYVPLLSIICSFRKVIYRGSIRISGDHIGVCKVGLSLFVFKSRWGSGKVWVLGPSVAWHQYPTELCRSTRVKMQEPKQLPL